MKAFNSSNRSQHEYNFLTKPVFLRLFPLFLSFPLFSFLIFLAPSINSTTRDSNPSASNYLHRKTLPLFSPHTSPFLRALVSIRRCGSGGADDDWETVKPWGCNASSAMIRCACDVLCDEHEKKSGIGTEEPGALVSIRRCCFCGADGDWETVKPWEDVMLWMRWHDARVMFCVVENGKETKIGTEKPGALVSIRRCCFGGADDDWETVKLGLSLDTYRHSGWVVSRCWVVDGRKVHGNLVSDSC